MTRATTTIELIGTEIEVSASSIPRVQHDHWARDGFPNEAEEESEEYEAFLDLIDANLDSGLVPDEDLQLIVNGKCVADLHGMINKHGRWKVNRRPLIEVPSHYLCALTLSKRSSFILEVPEAFDFSKLSWEVTDYHIEGNHLGFLLDASYAGRSFEYSNGEGFASQSVWLERMGV